MVALDVIFAATGIIELSLGAIILHFFAIALGVVGHVYWQAKKLKEGKQVSYTESRLTRALAYRLASLIS